MRGVEYTTKTEGPCASSQTGKRKVCQTIECGRMSAAPKIPLFRNVMSSKGVTE